MSMNLFKASNQWAQRPADETFWGIKDALATAKNVMLNSREALVPYDTLRVEAADKELRLVGKTGAPAYPTFSAAQQLCSRAKFPHSVVARQPATLAAQNINWGLREYRGGNDDNAALLLHQDGNGGRLTLRASTSEQYERLFHAQYLARMEELGEGWRVPPARPSPSRMDDPRIRPATEADVLAGNRTGLSVNVGDMIGPAGVYMSDKDLFVFLWNETTIESPTGGTLHRFALLFNNEIGTGSWGGIFGKADAVCGNHIIWGAQGVQEIRVRHVGKKSMEEGMENLRIELKDYSEQGANEEEAKLRRAAQFEIAAKKDDVVDAVFKFAKVNSIGALSRKRIDAAYDRAEQVGRYGNPNTPWALTNGLTELSQEETPHADERARIDAAAGRIIEMAF